MSVLSPTQKVLFRTIVTRQRKANLELIDSYMKRVDLPQYKDKREWGLAYAKKLEREIFDLDAFEADFLGEELEPLPDPGEVPHE